MHARSIRNREAGSAYVVALLVLVVLTIIGLGLALITQTELEIGANEKTMQRLFYAADSGAQKAIGSALFAFTCDPVPGPEFTIDDQDTGLIQEVETSAVLPFLETACQLCSVNSSGSAEDYSNQTYLEVHHAASATAVRRFNTTGSALGSRTVGIVAAVQPWQTNPECAALVNSDDAKYVKM